MLRTICSERDTCRRHTYYCTANKTGGRGRRKRRKQDEDATATRGKGVYAQPKLSPDQYVGDFDEIPIGLPGSAPCSLRICCCCLNAGEFETISNREEESGFPCCPCLAREKKKKKLPNNPKGNEGSIGKPSVTTRPTSACTRCI